MLLYPPGGNFWKFRLIQTSQLFVQSQEIGRFCMFLAWGCFRDILQAKRCGLDQHPLLIHLNAVTGFFNLSNTHWSVWTRYLVSSTRRNQLSILWAEWSTRWLRGIAVKSRWEYRSKSEYLWLHSARVRLQRISRSASSFLLSSDLLRSSHKSHTIFQIRWMSCTSQQKPDRWVALYL